MLASVVFRILCHFVKLSKKEMTYDQNQFRHGRCFSTELSKKTVLSNRRITLNFLNIGGI